MDEYSTIFLTLASCKEKGTCLIEKQKWFLSASLLLPFKDNCKTRKLRNSLSLTRKRIELKRRIVCLKPGLTDNTVRLPFLRWKEGNMSALSRKVFFAGAGASKYYFGHLPKNWSTPPMSQLWSWMQNYKKKLLKVSKNKF